MSVRALIIAGVILVILVLVSVFFGLRHGASAPEDLSPEWLEVVERRRALSRNDIESSEPERCARQFAGGSITLPGGSDCLLTVRSDDSLLPASRELNIELAQGGAEVVVSQPDVVTNRFELDAGDEETFSMFGDGGTISIVCVQPGSLGTCRVRVN